MSDTPDTLDRLIALRAEGKLHGYAILFDADLPDPDGGAVKRQMTTAVVGMELPTNTRIALVGIASQIAMARSENPTLRKLSQDVGANMLTGAIMGGMIPLMERVAKKFAADEKKKKGIVVKNPKPGASQ